MKTIDAICEFCGKEFKARWHDRQKGDGRFCGQACGGYSRARPATERIWDKVIRGAEDECWEYPEYKNACGYGVISGAGKSKVLAHRAAYLSEKGDIPKGMVVLHSCDNPACCNPKHLFVGTQADNIADMIKKGRKGVLKSEKCHKTKLTESDVVQIRQLYGAKDRHELSKMFGVRPTNIMFIVERKTWKHL